MFSVFDNLKLVHYIKKEPTQLQRKRAMSSCQKYSERFKENRSRSPIEQVGQEPRVHLLQDLKIKNLRGRDQDEELKYFKEKVFQISKEKSAVESELFQTAQLAKQLEQLKHRNASEISSLKDQVLQLENKLNEASLLKDTIKSQKQEIVLVNKDLKAALDQISVLSHENSSLQGKAASLSQEIENLNTQKSFFLSVAKDCLFSMITVDSWALNLVQQYPDSFEQVRTVKTRLSQSQAYLEEFEKAESVDSYIPNLTFSQIEDRPTEEKREDWISFMQCQACLLEEVLLEEL